MLVRNSSPCLELVEVVNLRLCELEFWPVGSLLAYSPVRHHFPPGSSLHDFQRFVGVIVRSLNEDTT